MNVKLKIFLKKFFQYILYISKRGKRAKHMTSGEHHIRSQSDLDGPRRGRGLSPEFFFSF